MLATVVFLAAGALVAGGWLIYLLRRPKPTNPPFISSPPASIYSAPEIAATVNTSGFTLEKRHEEPAAIEHRSSPSVNALPFTATEHKQADLSGDGGETRSSARVVTDAHQPSTLDPGIYNTAENNPTAEDEHTTASLRSPISSSVPERNPAATEEQLTVPEARAYRPPRIVPPWPRKKPTSQPRSMVGNEARVKELKICLQAIFDRHGVCDLRILCERPENGADELTVKTGRGNFLLSAYGDSWYQLQVDNVAGLLSDGIVLPARNDSGPVRWELSKRDVYVLCGEPGLAGFSSATRLSKGRKDQVVFCKAERQQEVVLLLEQAGCGKLEPHGEEFGAPPGWLFLREIQPAHSLPQGSADDILNILRPLPDIEISFDGGLCLHNSTWLLGYPPAIRITGDIPSHTAVTIDGHQAEQREDGAYIVPGWDAPGDHFVWCGGQQRTYSLERPEPNWQLWEPYHYRRGFVCGATAAPASGNLVTVPATNPVLVGARPGQIFRCPTLACKTWTGVVPFSPVWALPDANSNGSQILLLGFAEPEGVPPATVFSRRRAMPIKRWCRAIISCAQKEITGSVDAANAGQLRRRYVLLARQTWRRIKQHELK